MKNYFKKIFQKKLGLSIMTRIFHFLLKKHTKILDNTFWVIIITFLLSFLSGTLLLLSWKGAENETLLVNGLILIFLSIILFGFINGLLRFSEVILDIIRTKIPYKIKTVYELNKEYEVHCFPILNMEKFYYKGKLHRESSPAIVYYEHTQNQYYQDIKEKLDEYYINGIKIEKEKLIEFVVKYKISDF
jgi:hypothetical protein